LQLFTGGRAAFVVPEDQEQVDKLLELRARTGIPRTIVYDDARGLKGYSAPGLLGYREVAVRGRARLLTEPALSDGRKGRKRDSGFWRT
jgi:long-chain acyl-CoA synthetase